MSDDRGPQPWYRSRHFYRNVAVGVWRGLGRDDCGGMAAGVAYHFIFSFFAWFFFLACLATQFGRTQGHLEWILGVLRNFLPEQGIRLAEENIGRFLAPVKRGTLPLALFLSLWTAANVVEMVMKALNRIYSVKETRPLWRTRLWSLLIVMLVALFLIVAFNLEVFGDELKAFLLRTFPSRALLNRSVSTLRWPLVVLGTGGASLLIYFLAPNFRTGRRRVALPGAVFFTVGWQMINWGFDGYVNNFANFGRIYGPLGTALAVLVWVYSSAFLLLVGGEINAHIGRHLPRRATGPRDASGVEALSPR
jgi:membrane protein